MAQLRFLVFIPWVALYVLARILDFEKIELQETVKMDEEKERAAQNQKAAFTT